MGCSDKRSPGSGAGMPHGLQGELSTLVWQGNLSGIRRLRVELTRDWSDRGLSAEATCKRLTLFNRAVVLAMLETHAREYPWLTECTFMEFGSGGRGEQVLGSDQDNGLLLTTAPDPNELEDCTQSIALALDGAGIALCDGGVMLSNSDWRGDFETWLARLTNWLSNPAEKGPWQSGLILDFTAVFGSVEAVNTLRRRLWEYVRTKPIAVSLLIRELTDYRLPLTFYGAFITEKNDVWFGFLNIKHSILSHLTNSVRILALKYNLEQVNTCARLRALKRGGHVCGQHADRLLDGWEFLQRKRLDIGLECHRLGIPPHNYLNPAALEQDDRKRLKDTIHQVEKLVRLVQAGSGL